MGDRARASSTVSAAVSPARRAVAGALVEQVRRFPFMPVRRAATEGMEARDARLAMAIHRITLQRWLTLHYLLNRKATRRMEAVQPELRAILLSGAAQLLFMDRLPPHAVVHESVELAKGRLRRRGAAGLVNAVLRRLSELVICREPEPWRPAPDRLPDEDGSIRLAEPILPPLEKMDRHLSVAASHPVELVRTWREQFGDAVATDLLRHGLAHAPIIIHAPGGMERSDALRPHARAGFAVWRGDPAGLAAYLRAAPDRWVQDPASAAPVAATAGLRPERIVDFCAGRGTKTRQLAHLHPDASIIATDPDPQRFAELREALDSHPHVRVAPHDRLSAFNGRCDLLVLDVPCSNTGVLARRLEARYRFRSSTLRSLVELQRSIVESAAPLLRDGPAALLYATCSLQPQENERQAQWAAGRLGLSVQRCRLILPGGSGATYHDGGYHALLRRSS